MSKTKNYDIIITEYDVNEVNMKDKTVLYKISQGMYVLSTKGASCFVDAVSQVSGGENPLVCVAVMKKNYTNEVMHKTNHFALMVFGKNDNPDIIKTFGFSSSKEMDKFAKYEYFEQFDVKILKSMIGYMLLEKVDTIENETHTLFIGKVIDADKFKEEEAMTYSYYQEHKEELLKVQTERGKTAWVCSVCGYVYYGEELPNEFTCPVCMMPKEYFNLKKEEL